MIIEMEAMHQLSDMNPSDQVGLTPAIAVNLLASDHNILGLSYFRYQLAILVARGLYWIPFNTKG